MTRLLVATRSGHKMEEIRRILAPVPGLEVVGLVEAGIPRTPVEEELEPYETFRENAASKARYFHRLSGLPTVADDSGLVVDSLGGRPGVRSKRFAPGDDLEGEERDRANNRHLVDLLRDVPRERRTARYVCTAALIEEDSPREDPRRRHEVPRGEDDGKGRPEVRYFTGEASGIIVEDPRGTGGFGYDPHFFDPELGRTFAEISAREKNHRSHRGKAFRALAVHLGGPEAGAGNRFASDREGGDEARSGEVRNRAIHDPGEDSGERRS